MRRTVRQGRVVNVGRSADNGSFGENPPPHGRSSIPAFQAATKGLPTGIRGWQATSRGPMLTAEALGRSSTERIRGLGCADIVYGHVG